jgi:glycosyl transferase family 25
VNYPVPIYVINLDRSKERLARITADLAGAGLACRRLRAVEPHGLPPEYDAAGNRRCYLAPLSLGEIGCVLSHREAWRLIAADRQHGAALVLEDDAKWEGTADELRRATGALADSDRAELVKLYNLSPRKAPGGEIRLRRPLLPALTTTAQALNRAAARSLLAFTEHFHEPADVIIQRWWHHGVRVHSVDPPLFSEAGHDTSSTIRIRGAPPPEGRWRRELRRPLFQFHRLVRAVAARARGH